MCGISSLISPKSFSVWLERAGLEVHPDAPWERIENLGSIANMLQSELLFTSRTQKSRNSVNCYKSSHSAGERSEMSLFRRWCCDRIEAAIAYDHEVRKIFLVSE